MIAALYVQPNGCYFGLDGVDPWDEARDARTYAGPWPVVAHPPCARWCRMAGMVEKRYGIPRHQDDGCFEAALESVRAFGGVLEHPAWTDAWPHHGLNQPPSSGGWVAADFQGGWTCYIEQGRYGHRARKGTFLLAYGIETPPLRWGRMPAGSGALVGGADQQNYADRPRVWKRESLATPLEFRDLLLSLADSVN